TRSTPWPASKPWHGFAKCCRRSSKTSALPSFGSCHSAPTRQSTSEILIPSIPDPATARRDAAAALTTGAAHTAALFYPVLNQHKDAASPHRLRNQDRSSETAAGSRPSPGVGGSWWRSRAGDHGHAARQLHRHHAGGSPRHAKSPAHN